MSVTYSFSWKMAHFEKWTKQYSFEHASFYYWTPKNVLGIL